MKLRIILALSLLTNVILGLGHIAAWPKQPVPKVLPDKRAPHSVQNERSGPQNREAAVPDSIRSVSTWTHTRWPETINALRDLGLSDEQCYQVAEKLVENQLMRARRLIVFGDGDKIWQQGFVGGKLSDEKRLQIAALERERETLLAEILGPDYRRIRALAAYKDNPKYAWLPEDKLIAVAQILQDNDRVSADARRTAGRNFKPEEGIQLRQSLENDLREVLTPEEYEQLQAYTSPDARVLQRGLAGASISDEQYLSIYKAIKAAGVVDITKSLDESLQAIQAGAGSEAALHFVSSYDLGYAPAVPLLREMGLSAAEILRRRQRANDFFSNPNGSRDLAAVTYADVTKGMNETQKDVFNQSMLGQSLLNRMKSIPGHP